MHGYATVPSTRARSFTESENYQCGLAVMQEIKRISHALISSAFGSL
jgi:hypothetical protein